ncbi:hypothetical protein G6F65_021755 [Rhizopus arrhizus]|nr:hypothetical protein G6F65_021755 [Rhizopus arrhizus]
MLSASRDSAGNVTSRLALAIQFLCRGLLGVRALAGRHAQQRMAHQHRIVRGARHDGVVAGVRGDLALGRIVVVEAVVVDVEVEGVLALHP